MDSAPVSELGKPTEATSSPLRLISPRKRVRSKAVAVEPTRERILSAAAQLFADILNKGIAAQELSGEQLRLITEMYLGMLRSIILYHGNHDTPETMSPLAVKLFLDGLSNFSPPLEHPDIRLTTGGKSRVRATLRRATPLG